MYNWMYNFRQIAKKEDTSYRFKTVLANMQLHVLSFLKF